MNKILAFLILIISLCAEGSHIGGGEMTYQYISKASNGDVTYKVTLYLYLDCKDGDPKAIASDSTAFFNVFDAQSGVYLKNLRKTVKRQDPIRVSGNVYRCIKNIPDVCVDMYIYSVLMVLPKNSNGYIITFERCCRNYIIGNINEPGNTGATYWTEIKPESGIGKNSSPVFKERPPIFLCLNAPFVFNHSAKDEDGDSLAYELFTPFMGNNSTMNGTPVFPLKGNRLVTWSNSYNVNNQMGGNPILEVDPATGRITVTPTQSGQFVVGIKVKEYRNGNFIGETKRDYQFNVNNCVFDVVSSFSTAKVNCAGTSVVFKNLSSGAVSFHWDFGEQVIKSDTSNQSTPTYNYSKPGIYIITLIAKNSICVDTFDYSITVKSNNLKPDLGRDTIFCKAATLMLDAGISSKQYLWNTGHTTQTISVLKTGNYHVLVSDAPCSARDTVSVIIDESVFNAGKDTILCSDFSRPVIYAIPDIYKAYLWSDNTTTNTLKVTRTGEFWVTVTNQNNCRRTDTVEVFQTIPPKSQLKDTSVCIGDYALFDAQVLNFYYLWNTGESTRQLRTSQPGLHWVLITNGKCSSSDTAMLSQIDPGLDIGRDTTFCEPFNFTIQTNKPFLNYNWNNGGNHRVNTITKGGITKVTIQSIEGCYQSDSLNIITYARNVGNIFGDTTACNSTVVKLTASDGENYLWSNGDNSRETEVKEGGVYYVIISDTNACKDTVSHKIIKNPHAFPNDIYMPNVFTPNGDILNETFPDHRFHDLNAFYSLSIFNLWGEKLFETNSPNRNWDGNYNGNPCQSDTYIYSLSYLGCDNNRRTLKGTFQILR